MSKKKLYDEDGNVVKGAKVKKPFYKRWWFIALVAIIVVGAITGGDDGESATESATEDTEQVEETNETEPEETETAETTEEVEEEPEEEPEEEQVVEEEQVEADNIFEEKASEVFGDNLRDVIVEEAGPATDHYVGITAHLSGGWNERTMRDSFYYDIIEIASEVQDEEFDRIVFEATADMQDQYGNVEESRVITVNFTKDTVDKINFENFIADNIPNVADGLFIHPAFQD